jgi:signal transduction histidine kinase
LQSQGFSPVIKELDLHQLINELTGVYTMLAAEKKNRICADVPEKLICRQDATLIRIILHNLLLNSNKFTENGLITVGASLNKSTLYLFVKDTGIGMSPEKVASLNNMQPTGSSAGTVKETGWGMGYVFIIDLIRFSSGSLQVSSTEGEGTVVTIGLPVEANDTARHNL